MAEKRDLNDIVTAALDDFMADEGRVRNFLLDMMTDALRLSMTAEWEMEDNFNFTEGAVFFLAGYIADDLTGAEVAEIAGNFDLDLDGVDVNRYAEPERDDDDEDEA